PERPLSKNGSPSGARSEMESTEYWEVQMAWVGDVNRLVEDCARYWTEAGLPRRRVAEMRLELTQHLEAAAAEGRDPESVVGPDIAKFAETWAAAFKPAGSELPTWEEVMSGQTGAARRIRRELVALAFGRSEERRVGKARRARWERGAER